MSRLIKALLGTISILIIVAIIVGVIVLIAHLCELYPDAVIISFISLISLVVVGGIFWIIYDNE